MMSTTTNNRLAKSLPTVEDPTIGDGRSNNLARDAMDKVHRRTRRSHGIFAATAITLCGIVVAGLTLPGRSTSVRSIPVTAQPSAAAQPDTAQSSAASTEAAQPAAGQLESAQTEAPEVAVTGLVDVLPTLLIDALVPLLILAALVAVGFAAFRWIRRRQSARPLNTTLMVVLGTLGFLAAAVVTWNVTFDVYMFPSAAMEPTIEVGSRMIVAQHDTEPERGDLVMFVIPEDWAGPRSVAASRVVALGEDTVEASEGQLWINGIPASQLLLGEGRLDDFGPVAVEAGSVFLLSDNYERSTDSRRFGSVASESVTGTVRWVSGGLIQPT